MKTVHGSVTEVTAGVSSVSCDGGELGHPRIYLLWRMAGPNVHIAGISSLL